MDVFYGCELAMLIPNTTSCSPSHMYHLNSTQRCWTYKPHTAHPRGRRQCSRATDIWDIAECMNWLGEGCCPYQSWHEITFFEDRYTKPNAVECLPHHSIRQLIQA